MSNLNKIYVIGHKTPDIDSVVAAIAYANFKNKLEDTDKYVPVVAGEINKVTEYVLDKFGFDAPVKLDSAKGQNLILVDHNEVSQIVDGHEEAKIVEIIDHHKMGFSYPEPIAITVKPWGSTNSIIYKEYLINDIEIDKRLAGLMLSALLDDTVIIKSPTCTDIDKEIIGELAKIAEINDWQKYGMEMFKVKASVKDFSAEQIIKMDFKDYDFKAGKFGFGQVETVDLGEFDEREGEIMDELKNMHQAGDYHTLLLMITDIINEGSRVLVVTNDQETTEKALSVQLQDNKAYVEGLMSRKKQIVPLFTELFD